MSKLSIEGEVEEPRELDRADLAALPGEAPELSALAVIRLSVGPALDARPRTEAEHERLHRQSERSAEG